MLDINCLTVRSKLTKEELLHSISFSVGEGETFALIGESGSGKTTVVNMITRLLDVSSGTIRLDGEDITLKKGKELKEVYKKMQMVQILCELLRNSIYLSGHH